MVEEGFLTRVFLQLILQMEVAGMDVVVFTSLKCWLGMGHLAYDDDCMIEHQWQLLYEHFETDGIV